MAGASADFKFGTVAPSTGDGSKYTALGLNSIGNAFDELQKLPTTIKQNNAEEETMNILAEAQTMDDGTSAGSAKVMDYLNSALAHTDTNNMDLDTLKSNLDAQIGASEKQFLRRKTKEDIDTFDALMGHKQTIATSRAGIVDQSLDAAMQSTLGHLDIDPKQVEAVRSILPSYAGSDGVLDTQRLFREHPEWKSFEKALTGVSKAYSDNFKGINAAYDNELQGVNNQLLKLGLSNPKMQAGLTTALQTNNAGIPENDAARIRAAQKEFNEGRKIDVVNLSDYYNGPTSFIDMVANNQEGVNNNMPEYVDRIKSEIRSMKKQAKGTKLEQLTLLENMISGGQIPANLVEVFNQIGNGDESWGLFGFDQGSAIQGGIAELKRSLNQNMYSGDNLKFNSILPMTTK